MPRKARQKAESGIYHVMLRGIDRQLIFEDTEDYLRFLNIVQECREICGFQLFAYCLMGNHVHLLLKVQNDDLETVFKRIGGRYVYYYNVKYQRIGHLFQDRFRSEPVDDDAYFLTVLRYIHQNPVKAKLCSKVEDYPFSSFAEYLHESACVDTEFALGMIDRNEFARFNNTPNSDTCMEYVTPARRAVTDTQAQVVIEQVSHCKTIIEFQELDEKKKERFIKKIYGQGVSVRQLSRLTGTTRGKVERILKS